jgi:hypothetical protein
MSACKEKQRRFVTTSFYAIPHQLLHDDDESIALRSINAIAYRQSTNFLFASFA